MSSIPDPASSFEGADGKNATEGRDPVTGQFLPGRRGGSGRRKGARARWSEAFMADVEEAWKEMGPAAIRRALFTDPAGTIRGLIGILPKNVRIDVNPLGEIPDDILAAMVDQAERTVAAKAQPGDDAKPVTVIEAEALPFGLPPPTSAEQRLEAQRRDLIDQHDALAAVEPVAPAPASLRHPVGRASPEPTPTIERRNIAKLAADDTDVDPMSLF